MKKITKASVSNLVVLDKTSSKAKSITMKKNVPYSKRQNKVIPLPLRGTHKQKNKILSMNTPVSSANNLRSGTSNRYPKDKDLISDAFIILRLNEFEVMEETFGYLISSELSEQVSERIQQCLRTVDDLEGVSHNEFAIMLTDVESKKHIEQLVQRIQEVCNGEYVCSNLKLHMTVTIGVSVVSSLSTKFEEQLRYARIALRQAEHQAGVSMQFFSLDMLDDLQQRAGMIFELRRAIKHQRFVLHYQPQYDVVTQETVAVEALIRMQGQNDELIYPDGFIDLAEETGLILPIGHWVIQEACQQYRRWRDTDCAPAHIAVNVSAKQLADQSLIEIVDKAVHAAGIEYSNLELEITEQSLIKNLSVAEQVLKQLSDKGVRIAMDDFGTGYSSLSYLGQLPLNVLKIDRSFLQQIDNNERSAGLIRSMIYIAKELDLEVVAEGVENDRHQQFIRLVGCHLGQGYGYCRPQSVDLITTLLQSQHVQARGLM